MDSGDIPVFIKATLSIYRDCAVNAAKGLMRNWVILIASACAYIALLLASYVISRLSLGIAGGFMLGLLSVALTALYYSWLYDTLHKDKLNFGNILVFDWGLFSGVISVSFLLFILSYLLGPLASDPNGALVLVFINFLIVFLFNALPETVYIHRYESIGAFSHAAKFTRENWIEWYLPFVVMLLPALITGQSLVGLLFQFVWISPLLPATILIQIWSELFGIHNIFQIIVAEAGIFRGLAGVLGQFLVVLPGLIAANWFMLFRGHLFRELEGGTRRRRIYQAKQK